jgi:hypothetical protein
MNETKRSPWLRSVKDPKSVDASGVVRPRKDTSEREHDFRPDEHHRVTLGVVVAFPDELAPEMRLTMFAELVLQDSL